jgi:hypothetical protein
VCFVHQRFCGVGLATWQPDVEPSGEKVAAVSEIQVDFGVDAHIGRHATGHPDTRSSKVTIRQKDRDGAISTKSSWTYPTVPRLSSVQFHGITDDAMPSTVNVRPTAFLQHPFFSEWAAESIARDSTIRLPFGTGRTSPIDARDVAEVIAAILVSPATHIGKICELTGPRSQNMHGVAAEYCEALGRPSC